MVKALPAAPASWWRPPLGLARLLDALTSDARPPMGIIAAAPEPLASALPRLSPAACFTMQPWSPQSQALLPTVGQFVGIPPVVAPLVAAPGATFQTLFWFDPGLLPSAVDVRRVCACLAAQGRLAVIVSNAPMAAGGLSVLRLRHMLRRAGMRVGAPIGYLGPLALAYSAAARFALVAGRPDLYDHCHAAMRAAYAEGWPFALLGRTMVVNARRSPHPEGPSRPGPSGSGDAPCLAPSAQWEGAPRVSASEATLGRVPVTPTAALARLESWLETMRGPRGYGGPVAHWWGQCLRFTGAAADWRYEGVILGYLRLWQRSGMDVWLERACRAADDVLGLALPSGGYRNSSFELNPAPFGTPHEAACDVALLRLALALRDAGRDPARAERYAVTAARNLELVYADTLWDAAAGGFRDVPAAAGFVPNKQATAAEAWLALAEWRNDKACAYQYALPALRLIVRAQQSEGPNTGAIDQILTRASSGWHASGRYFPLYIARCLPALVAGAQAFAEPRLAEAARAAAQFVYSQISAHGECPLIVYANGNIRHQPCWVAATGDLLWGLAAARTVGGSPPPPALLDHLLAGQDSNGGLRTAQGFATILNSRDRGALPDLRDILHVVGWADKAFRYLAGVADPVIAPLPPCEQIFDAACVFRGRLLRLVESPAELRLEHAGRTVYQWRKEQDWARTGPAWSDLR